MSIAFTRQGIAAAAPATAPGEASSDEMLIARIADGDRLAMQTLFARHRTPVYRWLLRLVGNETVAEDLLSDVFLDVWRQAGRFEARAAVSTWLLAIARFKALSALRRRSSVALDAAMAASLEDPNDDPAVAVEKKDKNAILRQCLTALSREHQEI